MNDRLLILNSRLFFPFIALILACKLDSDKSIDKSKFTFKTGSDTQLFFKNVRQSYYDAEENKAAGLNSYRLSGRETSDKILTLNLAIVINYLQDEAYLLLEPGAAKGDPPFTVIGKAPSGEEEILTLEVQTKETTLHFVSDIYTGILKGHPFFLLQKGEQLPILNDTKSREAFRITVSDYFRLTRIY